MEELMLILQETSGAMSGDSPQLPASHQSFGRSADAINDNFTQIQAKLDLILSHLNIGMQE